MASLTLDVSSVDTFSPNWDDSAPDFAPMSALSPATTATSVTCANWFTEYGNKCVASDLATPYAKVIQDMINWLTLLSSAFYLIIYLNRAVGYHNVNQEQEPDKRRPLRRNFQFWGCVAVVVGCIGGFICKIIPPTSLKPDNYSVAFTITWSQFYCSIWVCSGCIYAHFINYWVVKLKKMTSLKQYSWWAVSGAILVFALSLLYDLYINIITPIYKSQRADLVRLGWIFMALPYIVIALMALLMIRAISYLHQDTVLSPELKDDVIDMFTMWCGSTFAISVAAVVLIFYLEFKQSPLSPLLTPKQATTLNATMQSYVIRFVVLLVNMVQLFVNAWVLGFRGPVAIPFVGEIYYAIRTKARHVVYQAYWAQREGRRSTRANKGITSTNSTQCEDPVVDDSTASMGEQRPSFQPRKGNGIPKNGANGNATAAHRRHVVPPFKIPLAMKNNQPSVCPVQSLPAMEASSVHEPDSASSSTSSSSKISSASSSIQQPPTQIVDRADHQEDADFCV